MRYFCLALAYFICLSVCAQKAFIPHQGHVFLYDDKFTYKYYFIIQDTDSTNLEFELIENSPFRFKVNIKLKNCTNDQGSVAWINKLNCAVYPTASSDGHIKLYAAHDMKSDFKTLSATVVNKSTAYVKDFFGKEWLYVVVVKDNEVIGDGWINNYSID